MADLYVLKVGGSLGGRHLDNVVLFLQRACALQVRVVIVHGGGPRITEELTRLGMELPFIDGMRFTPETAMPVVERVLASDLNGALVSQLRDCGIPACGVHGGQGLLRAKVYAGDSRTGFVQSVETTALYEAWKTNQVPVVAPVGSDAVGFVNVNADLAASAIAGAISAKRIVFLTDVAGIYSDFMNRVLLEDGSPNELEILLKEGAFSSGMIPKVTAVLAAFESGAHSAYVVDGADPAAIAWAAEDTGDQPSRGTRITQKEVLT